MYVDQPTTSVVVRVFLGRRYHRRYPLALHRYLPAQLLHDPRGPHELCRPRQERKPDGRAADGMSMGMEKVSLNRSASGFLSGGQQIDACRSVQILLRLPRHARPRPDVAVSFDDTRRQD